MLRFLRAGGTQSAFARYVFHQPANPLANDVNTPMVVWRLRDGKAGHERQTAGLLNAVARLRPIETFDIEVARIAPIRAYLRRATTLTEPPPALLVGAGHACQWPLLAARRAHGGRAVYCMKPGLPARFFDWCLIPRHDGAVRSAHVEPTFGVLNDMLPATPTPPDRTLVLIGGPSRHFDWNEDAVLKQVGSIVFGRAQEIVVSDSRRTPASTVAKLQSFARPGVEVISHRATSASWLRDTLDRVANVWVTADSVSMLFEVLTAGRALGVLAVRARRDDRISRVAPDLIANGLATSFVAWVNGATLKPAATPLAEAARCAELLLARWFPAL